MQDKVRFVRILNSSKVQGKELWVIASIVRMLNVLRVWIYEVELKLLRMDQTDYLEMDELKMLLDSSEHILRMLRQAYVVLQAKELKPELAFLEEELFKFETLYVHSNLYLIINEERIDFRIERFEFMRHALHGVLHDLSQPVSSLKNSVVMIRDGDQEQRDAFFDDIREVLVQSKSQIDRGFELIHGSFAVETLESEEIEKIIEESMEALLKHEMIEFDVHSKVHQLNVQYSLIWFKGLLSNVVDNAKKAFWIKGERLGHGNFERKIHLVLEESTIEETGQKALAIRITDTAIGYSDDILSQGFEEGKSEWTDEDLVGQGVGMSAHVEYIQHLGGEVILRNVDEYGNEGAELIVKLPVV